MRDDWVPLSASALVMGAMALVFGAVLNPSEAGANSAETLRIVGSDTTRGFATAVMYAFASVTLILGLPSVFIVFVRRGRLLGLAALSLCAMGAIGVAGFAMLLVFFRAMVLDEGVSAAVLDRVTDDDVLRWSLWGWIGCLYGGLGLLAVALLVARTVPRWVPLLMIVFVALLPVAPHLGRVGSAAQAMCLAVAFTGIAMAAVTGGKTHGVLEPSSF